MQTFVGRAGELEALMELAATSRHGPGAAVVVGEPGSGNDRLVIDTLDGADHVALDPELAGLILVSVL